MIKRIPYYLFLISLFFFESSYTQQYGQSKIIKTIYAGNDTVIFDTCSVLLQGFRITQNDIKIPNENFILNPLTSTLIFKKLPKDSIEIEYYYFPINFKKEIYLHDLKLNQTTFQDNYTPIPIQNYSNNIDLIGNSSLNKSGNISRGMMVGNNQNFSLNSNLNLQLSGELSPGIKILASVTDDNIPIQPEGNTQKLQDFDQVFIQVFNDNWKIITGDFWIKSKESHFLKYHKRGQGIYYQTHKKKKNGSLISTENSASLSKGKFARNVIQGVEGNQGPYRLNGNENESFIIILSGTENVYIDGELLQRGQNFDYTIDYNTAEITFTANHLINKDKRIIVEFQYSDKNYARSLLQSRTSFKKNNSVFFINAYGEQDSKNQPLQQNINDNDRFNLEQIGDEIDLAFSSGIDSVAFNDNLNMYKKVDSLGYEVYIHSINPDSARYQITFSEVSNGGGDYIIKEYNALGKVFQWVAPDTIPFVGIVKQGNYEPVKKLITPKKRQVISIGGGKKWNNSKLNYELTTSNMDLNTFSNNGNEDNIGLAGLLKLNNKRKLTEKWSLENDFSIEMLQKNFNRIERFRAVEFERNWNILDVVLQEDQLLGAGKINLLHNKNGNFSYTLNTFILRDTFSGIKNDIDLKWDKNFHADFKGSLLETNGLKDSRFMRHFTDLYIPIKKFKLGFKDIHEENKFYQSDTLSNASYRFYDWKVYIESGDSTSNKIQFYYQERYDWFKRNSSLVKATHAVSPGLLIDIKNNKKFKLKYNLALRTLITDSTITNIAPENSLTSRLNYQLKLLNGAFYTTSFLELGSGLELQKEFIYLEVPAGQGVYTWIDYNNNDIKELNEFEIALYNDQASYIKVFTPNNNYIKIYQFQFNQNLNLNLKRIIKSDDGISKFLSKFFNQTALNTQKKINEFDFNTLINPLVNVDDPMIQQMSNSVRNSLFFNRSSPKYSLEYVRQLYANKILLINGTDYRSTNKEQFKLRWNINKLVMVNSELNFNLKQNSSTYASSRNYHITEQENTHQISYQPNTLFRLSLKGRYSEKKNTIEFGDEKAYLTEVGFEVRKSKQNSGLINAAFNVLNINYKGNSNSAIGYEMLEGLQPGTNFTWQINIQKKMANNIQLTLNYNGRKSVDVRTIHTGGVQLRAFF